MSTHNICFPGKQEKLSQNYHQIHLLNNSSAVAFSVSSFPQGENYKQTNEFLVRMPSLHSAFDLYRSVSDQGKTNIRK